MYNVTLIYNDIVYVDGEFKRAELKKKGSCETWDDVETVLACNVELFGSVTVTIEEVSE